MSTGFPPAAVRTRPDRAGTVPPGLDWVAQLPSTMAPGFVYLAGACRGVPVGGGGRDAAEAGARLAGETAEVLAQLAAPLPCDAPADPTLDARWTMAPAPLRVAGWRVADGAAIGVPAAAIFLGDAAARAATAPPASLGLAAGPDAPAARRAGLLELVERDAAAAWWCENGPAYQLDAGLVAAAAHDLARLRDGAPRITGFLALPSRTGVAVVCAFSRDADGRGLAIGLKAAPDPLDAAAGALIELLQMELALELARRRAARDITTPGDPGPLARAALRLDEIAAFAARPPRPLASAPADFAALAVRCGPVTVVDLPAAPGGLAVAKVLAPRLRPLPGTPPAPGSPAAHAPLI